MKNKKTAALLVAVALLVAALSPTALAAGTIDPAQKAAITVSYSDGEQPLCGAAFDVFRVATVDAEGTYTVDPLFASYNVVIDTAALDVLASTLEGYVLRDAVLPTAEGVTDQTGQLVLDSLRCGMYLVLGYNHTQNGYLYTTEPFMVLLPSFDAAEDRWNYQVTVQPKQAVSTGAPDQTVARKVLKVWDDAGNEKKRPSSIEVQLLCDGAIYDTVTLNAGNHWRHVWRDLPADRRFTVTEKKVEGYTVEVTLEGITYVVTNKAKATKPPTTKPTKPGDKLPQTGQLWWPVYALVAMGLLCLVIGVLCRRGGKHEA